MTEEQRQAAEERLAILNRARSFRDMIESPGWRDIYALHTQWVEDARVALRKVDTADTAKAIDALQRWQLAENYLDLEAQFINHTLAQAEDIRGTVTLDDALMMETITNEQQPAPRPDPAGY